MSNLTWVFAVDRRKDRLKEVVCERSEVSHDDDG